MKTYSAKQREVEKNIPLIIVKQGTLAGPDNTPAERKRIGYRYLGYTHETLLEAYRRGWEVNDEMALLMGRISGAPSVYESGDFNTAILSLIMFSRLAHYFCQTRNPEMPVKLLNDWLVYTILAGSLLYGIFREEIPDHHESRFWWFLAGVVGFVAFVAFYS